MGLRRIFSWTQWKLDVQSSYKWVDKETALNMQVHPKVIDALCPLCLQRASAKAKEIEDAETRGLIRQWVVPMLIFLVGLGILGTLRVTYSFNIAVVAVLPITRHLRMDLRFFC